MLTVKNCLTVAACLLFTSSVSASDWLDDNQSSEPVIVYGDGYIKVNGVKYVPESKALQLAERQALAQEQIAARLEELLTVVAVTDKQSPAK